MPRVIDTVVTTETGIEIPVRLKHMGDAILIKFDDAPDKITILGEDDGITILIHKGDAQEPILEYNIKRARDDDNQPERPLVGDER